MITEDLEEALRAYKRDVVLICADMVETSRCAEDLPDTEFGRGYRTCQLAMANMLRLVARGEIPIEACEEVHGRASAAPG